MATLLQAGAVAPLIRILRAPRWGNYDNGVLSGDKLYGERGELIGVMMYVRRGLGCWIRSQERVTVAHSQLSDASRAVWSEYVETKSKVNDGHLFSEYFANRCLRLGRRALPFFDEGVPAEGWWEEVV